MFAGLKLPQYIGHDNAKQLLLQLRQQLLRQLSSGEVRRIELDASTLEQFDSSALAVLLALLRTIQQHRCEYELVKPSRHLSDLITLYGLDILLLSNSKSSGNALAE